MSKRITVMIADDLDKKLHQIQAKTISQTKSPMSYSKVINEVLRGELK